MIPGSRSAWGAQTITAATLHRMGGLGEAESADGGEKRAAHRAC